MKAYSEHSWHFSLGHSQSISLSEGTFFSLLCGVDKKLRIKCVIVSLALMVIESHYD